PRAAGALAVDRIPERTERGDRIVGAPRWLTVWSGVVAPHRTTEEVFPALPSPASTPRAPSAAHRGPARTGNPGTADIRRQSRSAARRTGSSACGTTRQFRRRTYTSSSPFVGSLPGRPVRRRTHQHTLSPLVAVPVLFRDSVAL